MTELTTTELENAEPQATEPQAAELETAEQKTAELAAKIELLFAKNTSAGCAALQELLAFSASDKAVYSYLERFMELLESDNSYKRTRGLLLLVANARWDEDNKIDENLDLILQHISDIKPITSRQLIAVLPQLVEFKPDLRQEIVEALKKADTSRYPLSMRGLVEKDIRAALQELQQIK